MTAEGASRSGPPAIVTVDDEPGVLNETGKRGVLGEESNPRMDRIAALEDRGRDEIGHVQVAVARARRPDTNRIVGESDMKGVRIRL